MPLNVAVTIMILDDTNPLCCVSKGLLRHALEHLLDGSRVADEAHRHLQALRRDVAHTALHVVRDPLDEVRPGSRASRELVLKKSLFPENPLARSRVAAVSLQKRGVLTK